MPKRNTNVLKTAIIAILAMTTIYTGCSKTTKEDADIKPLDSTLTEKVIPEKPTTELAVPEPKETDPEKIAIQTMIIEMYRWQEDYRPAIDMEAIIKDGLIVSFDMTTTKAHIKEIEKTGFFAQEFLDNILSIYVTENRMLKNKEVEWLNGDISPFGSDSSPWCNCQDVPTDNDPFGIIKFTYTKLTENEAIFNWSWQTGGDWNGFPNYKIRTVKEDGKWKIAWMEGWDHDTFTKIY